MSHDLLLQKLEYLGIREKSNDLLRSYLTNRQQCVRYKSSLSEFGEIKDGVAQGSLPGPSLFNILLNDLQFIKTDVKIVKYADDVIIIFPVKPDEANSNENLLRMQNMLNEVVEFYNDNDLKLNSSKSIYICIGKPRMEGLEFMLNSAGYQKTDKLNYLGLSIGYELKMDSYLSELMTKVTQAIGVLYNIRNKLPVPVLMNFYFGHIHSHLSYCSFVLLRCNQTEILRLQRLQSRSLKLIHRLPIDYSTIDLFESYAVNVLPIIGLIFFSALMMIKRYELEPPSAPFAMIKSHSKRLDQYRSLNSRTKIKKDDLCVAGINLYNSLPKTLKDTTNLHQFKNGLKIFLLEKREILLKNRQFLDRNLSIE